MPPVLLNPSIFATAGGGPSAFVTAVQADAPLGWWRQGDASGTTMTDFSGNARHGTYNGSPTLGVSGGVTADTDTAVDYGSVATKYGSVPAASWMNTSSFTVEAIIKPSSLTSYHAIVSRDWSPRGWTFYVLDGVLYVDNPGGSGGAGGTITLSPNTWYHVAMTYDGTTVKLYVNGALDTATTRTLVTPTAANLVVAANHAQAAFPLNGLGDEIVYYGSDLTVTQIAAHASAAGYSPLTALPATTWDLRGLSALPAGWARRGVASETFDAAGMSATYAANQGHYYTMAVPVSSGTLEVKMVSGPTGAMHGPIVAKTAVQGANTSWYTGPSGALILGVGSGYGYDGNFVNDGGTPAYPVWFRVRIASAVAYGSYSFDGTTWSSEVSIARASMTTFNQLGVGSILSSATSKIEYVKWIP